MKAEIQIHAQPTCLCASPARPREETLQTGGALVTDTSLGADSGPRVKTSAAWGRGWKSAAVSSASSREPL